MEPIGSSETLITTYKTIIFSCQPFLVRQAGFENLMDFYLRFLSNRRCQGKGIKDLKVQEKKNNFREVTNPV
jgi:hypothetical protein